MAYIGTSYDSGLDVFPIPQTGESEIIEPIFSISSPTVWPVALRGMAVGTTAPASPSLNDIWVDTS
jgi:hypothetical protein